VDTEISFTVEESPEGGFEARAVEHAIFTQAGTYEELKAEIQDAVRCHFDDGEQRLIVIRSARIPQGT
jgi:predicted RNase H-like HicB family nuclease